jgi:parallel beta-helix repeat protein
LKKSWWIVIVLLLCPIVFACDTPLDGKTYTASQDFCNKRYYIPNGITIETDNVVLNCNNAILQGDFKTTGISIRDAKNVEIKNCNIINFRQGIDLKNVTNADIHDNQLLRNFIGVHIENSNGNHLYKNRDVSITETIKGTNSFENHIKYLNKNIEGDLCRHNSCNEKTLEIRQPVYQHYSLASILNAAIKKFIGMDAHSLQ